MGIGVGVVHWLQSGHWQNDAAWWSFLLLRIERLLLLLSPAWQSVIWEAPSSPVNCKVSSPSVRSLLSAGWNTVFHVVSVTCRPSNSYCYFQAAKTHKTASTTSIYYCCLCVRLALHQSFSGPTANKVCYDWENFASILQCVCLGGTSFLENLVINIISQSWMQRLLMVSHSIGLLMLMICLTIAVYMHK